MIVNEISLVIQNKNDINADKKVNELNNEKKIIKEKLIKTGFFLLNGGRDQD